MSSQATMFRLSVMMFLQFFVWGAWYVSMTGFINDQQMTDVTGAAYSVGPIAAIIAPFFLGMIADRFFPSERVLGVLHLLGGTILCLAPWAARPFRLAPPPEGASLFFRIVLHDLPAYVHPFILVLFAHMLCYMPTLGLTTSLSFHNLANQEEQFPLVRVWGTIGWIVGNIAVSFLPQGDQSPEQFYLAGIAGILLGLYSFTLPHTPPPLRGQRPTIGQILGTDSLRLFRSPSYAVFIICSFLICIPLAGYYQQARTFVESQKVLINNSATFTMSLGQMSEVFFMWVMPWFFAFLGVKRMLAVGMGAWVLRYTLFAVAAVLSPGIVVKSFVLLGVLLHGICYDFFFVTGMIYVDKKAPSAIRHQAQGFLVLITQGLGLGIGSKLFMAHVRLNTVEEVHDWAAIWTMPAVFAGAILVAFILLFWDRTNAKQSPEAQG
ncbi:MAG: MFS transporter [Pirellulaceae bacterium]|nr:MAG: MFS transporter [Pirellulaceae bacterium]